MRKSRTEGCTIGELGCEELNQCTYELGKLYQLLTALHPSSMTFDLSSSPASPALPF